VDDAAAQLLYALKRFVEVGDREVGQRDGVARPATTLVDANLRARAVRLPAAALLVGALLERNPEQVDQKRRARSGSSAGNSTRVGSISI